MNIQAHGPWHIPYANKSRGTFMHVLTGFLIFLCTRKFTRRASKRRCVLFAAVWREPGVIIRRVLFTAGWHEPGVVCYHI